MTRDEIYKKVQGVLVDALGVDEEEVTPTATLKDDLGAESIDYLDIVFRLEKSFNIKIPRGELFPEDLEAVRNDPKYVADGVVTPEGLAEFKRRMPYTDFSEFEKDPQVEKAATLLTVDTITNYVVAKVGA
ncbi:MAG: acyl carrier protein [Phycisphaerae bacterium]|nr:acyl carrier protein [Tepidisphaeraceae bacterium]